MSFAEENIWNSKNPIIQKTPHLIWKRPSVQTTADCRMARDGCSPVHCYRKQETEVQFWTYNLINPEHWALCLEVSLSAYFVHCTACTSEHTSMIVHEWCTSSMATYPSQVSLYGHLPHGLWLITAWSSKMVVRAATCKSLWQWYAALEHPINYFNVRTDALAAVSAVHCYPIVQVHLWPACR